MNADAPGLVVQPQHGRAAGAKVALGRGDRFFWGVAVEHGTVDARKKWGRGHSGGDGGEVISEKENPPDVFLTLGDVERLRLRTEVDRPAHAADFAADGANTQLVGGESESPRRVCAQVRTRRRTW